MQFSKDNEKSKIEECKLRVLFITPTSAQRNSEDEALKYFIQNLDPKSVSLWIFLPLFVSLFCGSFFYASFIWLFHAFRNAKYIPKFPMTWNKWISIDHLTKEQKKNIHITIDFTLAHIFWLPQDDNIILGICKTFIHFYRRTNHLCRWCMMELEEITLKDFK